MLSLIKINVTETGFYGVIFHFPNKNMSE